MARYTKRPLAPLIIAVLVCSMALASRYAVQREIDHLKAYYEGVIDDQMQIIYHQQDDIDRLRKEVEYEQLRNHTLQERVEDMEKWVPVEMEATGYAPLDPQAVPGMCYSGDPTITASGEPSTPGVSIAAGPGVPFGTEIYVPGYGVGVVHDRGGLISDDHIDLMFATRGQALAWGRQTVTVWVKE